MTPNLKALDPIFKKYSVAYLMRHAHRFSIPQGTFGHEVQLTQEGKKEAQNLAQLLKPYLVDIFSSPVPRCLKTAHYLQNQSQKGELIQLQDLGSPGIYIENAKKAGTIFLKMPPKDIATALLKDKKPLPGFCNAHSASMTLLKNVIALMDKGPGLYPFISHDYIISVFLRSHLKRYDSDDFWPHYLEGTFIWKEGSSIMIKFQDKTYGIDGIEI